MRAFSVLLSSLQATVVSSPHMPVCASSTVSYDDPAVSARMRPVAGAVTTYHTE